jgi:hypothetical protein
MSRLASTTSPAARASTTPAIMKASTLQKDMAIIAKFAADVACNPLNSR